MPWPQQVANLFSGSTATESNHNSFEFQDHGLSNQSPFPTNVTSDRRGSRPDTMAQKAVEEEGRPPYLHVSHIQAFSIHEQFTNIRLVVNDCWRNWGHHWRPSNALPRHSQDTPTGRSPCSAEIHNHGIILLHDIPARGLTTGSLRRMATSNAWLLSWNHYLLRHI